MLTPQRNPDYDHSCYPDQAEEDQRDQCICLVLVEEWEEVVNLVDREETSWISTERLEANGVHHEDCLQKAMISSVSFPRRVRDTHVQALLRVGKNYVCSSAQCR